MAFCKMCGAQNIDGIRFCADCGADMVVGARQPGYGPMAQQRGVGQPAGGVARAAQGLGVAGGILGVIWGGLAPYLTYKMPNDINWSALGTDLGRPEVGLIIGVVLGLLGIIGGIVATRSRGAAAFLLLFCGVVGFILGPTWLFPGAMLLAAGGLAMGANRA